MLSSTAARGGSSLARAAAVFSRGPLPHPSRAGAACLSTGRATRGTVMNCGAPFALWSRSSPSAHHALAPCCCSGSGTWVQSRALADKSGKKGKSKSGGNLKNLQDAAVDLSSTAAQMDKAVEVLRGQMDKFRVGKISPALLDHLTVTVGGKNTSLGSVGQVAAKDGQTLVVACFDTESAIAVEQAVAAAKDLKVTPTREGSTVRVSLPKATKEYRDSLVRLVKQEAESIKVRVRRVRQDAIKMVRGEELAKDDAKKAEDMVQSLTDRANGEIDQISAAKIKELSG